MHEAMAIPEHLRPWNNAVWVVLTRHEYLDRIALCYREFPLRHAEGAKGDEEYRNEQFFHFEKWYRSNIAQSATRQMSQLLPDKALRSPDNCNLVGSMDLTCEHC